MTTQQCVGFQLVFKGWVVRNWENILEAPIKNMNKLNKIIVKQSVLLYSKAWSIRNEVFHDEDTYRRYVISWNKQLTQMITEGNKPEMNKYIRAYPLDIERCSTQDIKRWNLTATQIYRSAENEKIIDIRNYFESKMNQN